MTSACPRCGRPLSEHDRDIRFRLPDPLAASPGWDERDGLWMSEPDPHEAVMMQVPPEGAFVRCLLQVSLSGGHTVTFGVWLGVHPDDLREAFRVWWSDEYVDLRLEGRLANALPGWGLLGAPVVAEVRDPEETPYVVSSTDDALTRVLRDEWPHEDVLARLPS